MPTVITRAEYLEVNGIPLATPAFEITDLSPIYDPPAVRGGDRTVPYHEGVLSLRRWLAERRPALPFVVYGDVDHENTPYASAREGLRANLDYLLENVFRPKQNATTRGTVEVKLYLPDASVRRADGLVSTPVQFSPIGPTAARGVLDLTIPGGVLRNPTLSTTSSGSIADGVPTGVVVPNAGTADQYEVVIELTGTATSVRIESSTWDAAGDTYLEFNGSLGTLTTIDTAEFTADRDGTSVIGLINHSGHERWLPLVPGDNTITVTPDGGTVTATFKHYAPYL